MLIVAGSDKWGLAITLEKLFSTTLPDKNQAIFEIEKNIVVIGKVTIVGHDLGFPPRPRKKPPPLVEVVIRGKEKSYLIASEDREELLKLQGRKLLVEGYTPKYIRDAIKVIDYKILEEWW